jgi:hypothetical protein
LVHIGATLIIFLQPSVTQFAETHKNSSGAILLVWGLLLHWMTSPKNADVVAAAKGTTP